MSVELIADTEPSSGISRLAAMTDAKQIIAEIVWSRAFDRRHDAAGQAELIAGKVLHALRREGLIVGSSRANASEILEKVADPSSEPPIRGISHLVAEALVLLNLPTVHRDTVRDLMPQSDARATKKTIGMQFIRALRKFSSWRWIDRADDGLITVLDRESLIKWFTVAVDANEDRAATTLDLARAIRTLKGSIAAGDNDELRRRELIALQRLMQSAPGAVTNERGTVRVVPRSRAL